MTWHPAGLRGLQVRVIIYSYLDKNNLVYNKQFGFRSNYSTNHAILSVTEHICGLLDASHYVCGIFVDLEKAFDTSIIKFYVKNLMAYEEMLII